MNSDGYHKLLLAIVKQWNEDGKPKAGEDIAYKCLDALKEELGRRTKTYTVPQWVEDMINE